MECRDLIEPDSGRGRPAPRLTVGGRSPPPCGGGISFEYDRTCRLATFDMDGSIDALLARLGNGLTARSGILLGGVTELSRSVSEFTSFSLSADFLVREAFSLASRFSSVRACFDVLGTMGGPPRKITDLGRDLGCGRPDIFERRLASFEAAATGGPLGDFEGDGTGDGLILRPMVGDGLLRGGEIVGRLGVGDRSDGT